MMQATAAASASEGDREGSKREEKHQEVEDVVNGALPQRGSTPRSKSAHHVRLAAQLNHGVWSCLGRVRHKHKQVYSHSTTCV